MKFEIKEQVDEKEIEWQNWYADMDAGFTLSVSRIHFNGERSVFYLINEDEGVGTSVFCEHHENAKYKDSQPHGVRLAAAIGRFFSFEGEVTADELVSAMNDYITDNDALTVGVSKTDKGVLWTVTASK